MTSSEPNVPPASDTGKSERIPTSVSFESRAVMRVVDVAAKLKGKDRSTYMVEHAVAAAERDLRGAGIDPDAIRQAA